MKSRKLISIVLAVLLALMLCAPAFAAEENDLTRGEFVSALFELSGVTDMEPRQAYFEDVPMHGDLALAVRWAVGEGIVSGYGDGRFGPVRGIGDLFVKFIPQSQQVFVVLLGHFLLFRLQREGFAADVSMISDGGGHCVIALDLACAQADTDGGPHRNADATGPGGQPGLIDRLDVNVSAGDDPHVA